MAELKSGKPDPRKMVKKGNSPLYDELIEKAANGNKYIFTDKLVERECIRKRAGTLGYKAKTSKVKTGGWNVEIFKKEEHVKA